MIVAANGVEIDVERDGVALGRGHAVEVLARAGERPFLCAEQAHSDAAPTIRNQRCERARHGEHDRDARCVVHCAFGEIVAVNVRAQGDASAGLAGQVEDCDAGSSRVILAGKLQLYPRALRAFGGEPRGGFEIGRDRRDAHRAAAAGRT